MSILHILREAIYSDDTDQLSMLIEDKNNLAIQLENNKVMAEIAADNGQWNHIKFLAEKFPTNMDDSFKYGYALCRAVKENQLAVVEALLRAQAPVKQYYLKDGESLLQWAIANNND